MVWVREQTRDGENALKLATAISHYHPWDKGRKLCYQSPVRAGVCGKGPTWQQM